MALHNLQRGADLTLSFPSNQHWNPNICTRHSQAFSHLGNALAHGCLTSMFEQKLTCPTQNKESSSSWKKPSSVLWMFINSLDILLQIRLAATKSSDDYVSLNYSFLWLSLVEVAITRLFLTNRLPTLSQWDSHSSKHLKTDKKKKIRLRRAICFLGTIRNSARVGGPSFVFGEIVLPTFMTWADIGVVVAVVVVVVVSLTVVAAFLKNW